MELLEEFVSQTGKKPSEWTSQDIQKYLDYVKHKVAGTALLKKYDN